MRSAITWAGFITVGAAMLVGGSAAPTRGQVLPASTATPGSTPTAATPPDGQTLLDAAQQADAAAGSVHIENERHDLQIGRRKTVIHQRTDMAPGPQEYHYIISTTVTELNVHPVVATSSRLEIVIVGARAAVRTGRGGWMCGTVTTGTVTVPTPPRPPAIDLGPTTIDGIAAWDVRTIRREVNGKTASDIRRDDFISQLDDTTVRAVVRTSVRRSAAIRRRILDRSDFSRYGLPVAVALPPKCQGALTTSRLGRYLQQVRFR